MKASPQFPTFEQGCTILYNDGRPGHLDAKALVLRSDSFGMTVQFEDRADTTEISFTDRQWMDFIRRA